MDEAAASEDDRTGIAVLYFVPNSLETKALARAKALGEAGIDLTVIGFRRPGYPPPDAGQWQVVDLGELRDGSYLGRIRILLHAAAVAIPTAGRLAKRKRVVVIARNLDLALLARLSMILGRLRAPFVYEVLDIREVMVGPGLIARALRWAERRVLAAATRLWISAPKFAAEYFEKLQKFGGEWRLLENKIVEVGPVQPDNLPRNRWVIGWFGALRCTKSLDFLCSLASEFPDSLEIYIRGFPTTIDASYFHQRVGEHRNIVYDGPYSHDELPEMMARIHFSWSFDYVDTWGNSTWLLPNRIYEAGYYERPLLGDADHATGARIDESGLGWTFSGDTLKGLREFLRHIDHDGWDKKRAAIAAMDKGLFFAPEDVVKLVEEVSERTKWPKRFSHRV